MFNLIHTLMNYNRFLTFLGAGMIMLASCVQKELSPEVEGNATFTAAIETPSSEIEIPFNTRETKTFIDERDVYESGVGTLWRKKETIGVYGGSSKNVKFTSTNSSNAASVSFSGTFWGNPQFAYYPYSASNKNAPATAVKGTLPSEQEYDTVNKDIMGDYRAGVFAERNWFSSTFTFKRLVSVLKYSIDATGTALEGSNVQKVEFLVSNKSKISGDFTINLNAQTIVNGTFAEGNDKVSATCPNEPTLFSGNTLNVYMTCLPAVQPGDEMTFIITTNTHRATIKRTSKVAFTANGLYYFPLILTNFPDMNVEQIAIINPSEPETPAVGTHPVLHSMKFTVEDNPGKILPGQVSYNTSSKRTTYSANKRSEEVCTVDTVNHKVTAFIPYLGSRKLVPVFEIPEGTKLCYEGGEIISGVTEVDFARFKQIAVVNEVEQGVIYDVELANTGLPVVVVNQASGLSRTSDGFWENATGTQTQAKDSDWIMEDGDSFMVYNPDGTSALLDKNGANVDVPVLSSTRLRGNVSQKMPKKPFAVKLDKKHAVKITKANGEVVNMTAHKRWVLLANWSDRTLMRNAVAYDVAKIFENNLSGSIAWNVSGEFVELVYNGVHVGNYYLCEQVKIDGNRLDIADPYDKDDAYSGNPADYGYLLDSDDAYDEAVKFMSKHYIPFQFKDDADAGGEMLQYAKDIVYGIEENLYKGYSGTTSAFAEAYKTMDLTSFVDFLLIQELMMNGELKHPKSCYTYINDGKLYAGPIWDFDWQTIPNISVIESYYDNAYTGGANTYNYTYTTSMLAEAVEKSSWFSKTYYCFRKSSGYPSEPNEDDRGYMWYPMLVKDATFKATAAERWNVISGLVTAYANTEIPKMAAEIRKSEELNWSMWKLESGSGAAQQRWSTYDVGGGFKGDEAMTFDNAVSTLSSNLNNRINGMSYVSNQNWPSITIQSSTK